MNLQNIAFIGSLGLVSLAFFALLADFFQPIFWAATLAVIFHAVYERLLQVLRQRESLAALFTLIIICITVLLPLAFIATAFANEAANLYGRVEAGELSADSVLQWAQMQAPTVFNVLDRAGLTVDDVREGLASMAVVSGQYVGSLAVSAGQNVLRLGIMFFLMLYTLFFFLRDGEALIEAIIHALPLGDERERALLSKFAEVSRATIKGTLVIGGLQGTLGGLIFWALGIEGAVFWGCVMVVLSLVPVVGASIIWVPAAIGLAVGGDRTSAIILTLFGVVVIGLIDNLLRPLLVGRDTRMPDYIILLSTLGGITMFGASGFVIGPIIAAMFLSMWVMFAREFNGVDLGRDD